MQFFCHRSQDLFERCIDNVLLRAILGLGSLARFSLKCLNVIFICIMKCKQAVYRENKVEKSEFKPIAVIFFLCATK